MNNNIKVRYMVYGALFISLTAICSWITIPATVQFTLQTFAVFLTLLVMGGKWGTITVFAYVFTGLVGLPVFSGFKGGPGVLFGTTGGYIIGFIVMALIYWAFTGFIGRGKAVKISAMLTGLGACYAFGTAWFMIVYTKTVGVLELMTALGWCVLPFIVPDLAKMALAWLIYVKLKQRGMIMEENIGEEAGVQRA